MSGKKKNIIKQVLDGSILMSKGVTGQFPFILFMAFIAVVYIWNRFHAEKLVRDTAKVQKEVKDLRYESITIASELMYLSNQSEISKMVDKQSLGLYESVDPPIKIVVKEE